jgi:outer membrane protein assembly factor BamE (lipoprotein component of BamABCDE complex)
MQKHLPLLLALPLLVLGSCVLAETTDGNPLPPQMVAEIQPGVTTRAEVAAMLGAPDEVVYSNREHDPLFERAFRYRRTKTRQTALFLLLFSTFQSETRWDHVLVFFDDAGVVENVGVALDRDDAEYGLAF